MVYSPSNENIAFLWSHYQLPWFPSQAQRPDLLPRGVLLHPHHLLIQHVAIGVPKSLAMVWIRWDAMVSLDEIFVFVQI